MNEEFQCESEARMDQVFCPGESVVMDQQLVLEEIEQELATISHRCPDGEETFERLLQLLAQLVTVRQEAADDTGFSGDDDRQSDFLSQKVRLLSQQLEDVKGQSRKQREEAEDENQKLLSDKTEQTLLIQSLRRQIETLQHESDEQITQLAANLQSEQRKTQRLEQNITSLKEQVRCAGRLRRSTQTKSLADEIREVLVNTGSQTGRVIQRSVGQQTTDSRIRKLEVVHIGNESSTESGKRSVLITRLQSVRLFLILVTYFAYELYSLHPVLCEYILWPHSSAQPPL